MSEHKTAIMQCQMIRRIPITAHRIFICCSTAPPRQEQSNVSSGGREAAICRNLQQHEGKIKGKNIYIIIAAMETKQRTIITHQFHLISTINEPKMLGYFNDKYCCQ